MISFYFSSSISPFLFLVMTVIYICIYTHTGKCGVKRKVSIPALILSPVAIYIPNRYLYISNKLHSIYIWLLQILLIDRKNVHRHFPQTRSFKFKVSCTLLFSPFQFLMTIHLDLSVTLVAK